MLARLPSGDGEGSGQGDREREGDESAPPTEPPNVFDEEPDAQVRSTRQWLRSGSRFRDDLALVRIPHRHVYKWLLQQLQISGDAWERAQQRHLVENGSRKYRLLVAHDAEQTYAFMDSLGDLMWSDAHWLLIRHRTEAAQLRAFQILTRGAGMAEQLVLERNTNHTYRALTGVRDPGIFEALKAAEPCTLDSYTLEFVRYYGCDLGSDMSIAELELIVELGDSDTLSTERAHSVNSMQSSARRLSHKLDLPTLSSYCIGRLARDQCAPSAPSGSAASGRRGRTAVTTDPAKRRRRGRGGGGGAWRAFVHVHAAGQRCSGDFFKELSERFANLEPGAKEHYIELGKIGADLHRRREKSFGARKRRRIERQPLRALPAPERDADEDEADGAEAGREEDADMTAVVVARDAEALPEAGQRGISFIEEEAQQVQSSYRHAEHAQRQAAIADEAFLQEHSNNHAAEQAEAFGLGSSTLGGCTATKPSHRTGLRWYMPEKEVKSRAATMCEDKTEEAVCWEWRKKHHCIMHNDCQQLGSVPTARRLCWEARCCIHSGEGRLLARLHNRLANADRQLKKSMGKDKYNDMVCTRGMLVIRLRGEAEALEGEHKSLCGKGVPRENASHCVGKQAAVWEGLPRENTSHKVPCLEIDVASYLARLHPFAKATATLN